LDSLDDPGVLAEVARYQHLSTQLPAIAASAQAFEDRKAAFTQIYDKQQEANRGFLAQLEASRQCLKYGRVRTRVQEAMTEIVDARATGGWYYWMGLPGRPEHPNRHYLPGAERTWRAQGPEETANDDRELEVKVDLNDPLVCKKRIVAEVTENRQHRHKCHWCREKGHFNKACPIPHIKCVGVCDVPVDHANFSPVFCKLPHKKRKGQGHLQGKAAKILMTADVPSCHHWD
jgi:hypothetical protein